MRVALITNVAAPYRTPLFERIADSPGCQLLVVYETRGEPNRDWKMPPAAAFDYVVLDSRTLDFRRLGYEAFVHVPRRPLHAIRQFAPDVVVTGGSGIWSSPTNLAAVLGRSRGWRIAEWWQSPPRPEPTLPRRLATPWVRAFVRASDAWIAFGSRAASEVIRLGADAQRTVIAPNAVPLPQLPTASNGRPHRPPRFLFVGQLIARKGVDLLLEAFQALNGAELWIAGDGPLRPLVEQAATSDQRIRYLGHLQSAELEQRYREADVLVLPSRYEVWGLVVNEAMARGLPVIVTDQVGAAQDLVDPGINGLIAPADSVQALSQSMRALHGWQASQFATAEQRSNEILSNWTIEHARDEILRACNIAAGHRDDRRAPLGQ